MAKRNRVIKARTGRKRKRRTKPAVVTELASRQAGLVELPAGPIAAFQGGSLEVQAARLGDPRWQTAQRQALAAQIGQVQGNRHLQRVIASQHGGVKVIQPELTKNTPMIPIERVAGNTVQRGFWSRLWRGIKSAGRAIASGARAVGSAIASGAKAVGSAIASGAKAVRGAIAKGAKWLGGRLRDVGLWVVNLIRDLPGRLRRLAITLWKGLSGVVSFIPEAIRALAKGGLRGFADWLWERAKSGGAWVLRLLSRVFDVLGGPELVQFLAHLVTHATPLKGPEIAAASSVLGPKAIRYGDVRIAEGGLLDLVFRLNQGRAFTSWHTINMPSTGAHGRSNLAIVVHELVHVYQYEKVGTVYMGQAIHAQMTVGYGYKGAAGLTADRAAGKHYRDYNREQQAQIAQDYYTLRQRGEDTTAYEPFIAELRAGEL